MGHTITIRLFDKNGVWLKDEEIPSHAAHFDIVLDDIKTQQLPIGWDTLAVCPDCKKDFDVEKSMCISCGCITTLGITT